MCGRNILEYAREREIEKIEKGELNVLTVGSQ